MTDYDNVYFQMKNLYIKLAKIPYVSSISFPEKHPLFLGTKTIKINANKYREVFDKMIEENIYTILLHDFSIINLYYEFDEKGILLHQSLSYIPYYENDFFDTKYMRVDFEMEGRREFVHSLIHLHYSIYKNDIRLPVEKPIMPNQFVFFVLKYYYHINDKFLNTLDCRNFFSDKYLTQKEAEKLIISFSR